MIGAMTGGEGGSRRPRLLYLLNGFEAGGAELGLVRLVRGGLFEGFELTVAGLGAGDPEVRGQLASVGVEPLILGPAAKPRARDLPRLFAAVVGLARRLKPDVVVLSLPQANLLGRLASLVWRPPVVISFEHNVRLARRSYEILFWLTSPLVDWMFADAEATAREAARRFYAHAPGRTSVAPLVWLPDQAPAAPPPRFTVVNAARFTPPKNQAALIRAAALLRDRGIDVDLVLYGEGPERDACEALARALGVADRVSLPGFVPDWPARPASAFVLASRHEGLCIALLEAMNAGLPVATPLTGGVADYAGPENALVLPDVEPATLAAAMEALIADPDPAAARAAAGRARVRANYGETAVAARLRGLNAELHGAVRAFPSPPAPIRR